MTWRICFWTAALLPFLLVGCATLGLDQESRLRQRVAAYWEAIKIGDFVAAYHFEEVSLGKISLQNYVKGRGGIRYRSYRIESIRFPEPDEAEVTLAVEYTAPPVVNRPVKSRIIDRWVRRDGTWYHVARKRW